MLSLGDNQEPAAVEPAAHAASPELAIQDPASSIAETVDAAPASPDLTRADADLINDMVFGPSAASPGEPEPVADDAARPVASNRPRRDAGAVIASTLKGVGGKLLKSRQLTTAAAVWAEGAEDLGGYAAGDLLSADVVDILGEFEGGRTFLRYLEGSETGGLLGKVGSLGVSGVLIYHAMTKAIQADVMRLQSQPQPQAEPIPAE